MAERQDFQLQGSVRSQRGCEGSEHQNQPVVHAQDDISLNPQAQSFEVLWRFW